MISLSVNRWGFTDKLFKIQVVRRKGRFSGQIRISSTKAYTSRTIFSTTSFAP